MNYQTKSLMKKLVYLLFVCVSTISCGGNSNSPIMKREDSIRQVKDSFSNTIVNISYKGLEIGAKADNLDSLLLGCGVFSTKSDGHFIQGRHEITYVDKNNEAHIIGIGNINFFTAQTEL